MALSIVVAGEDPAESAGLAKELIRQGIDVRPETRPAPEGSKSGLATTATLVITGLLSAPAIQGITQVVLARLRRGRPGAITFTDGEREFTVENASPETERALVAWITEQSK